MTFRDFLPPILTKAFTWSRVSGLFALRGPTWSNTVDYQTLLREGFTNAVVYACITEIMRAAGGVSWMLKRRASTTKGAPQPVADDDPAWSILRRAKPLQSGTAFKEATVAYYCLAGNVFIARVSATAHGKEIPHELHLLVPDRQRYTPLYDPLHELIGYAYTDSTPTGGQLPPRLYALPTLPDNGQLIYQGPPKDPDGFLLHLKQFTPNNDWYGLSPILAAAHSVDNLNAALAWNTALLQQSCRPPLSLTTDTMPAPETQKMLREQIEEMFSGPQGAGKPLLLWGGMKAEKIGMSPMEMDWLKGTEQAGLDICRVLNMPAELVGFAGSKTRANYATARKSLYTETIFPILGMLAEELTHWLLPFYDDTLYLDIDRDNVDAIREDRARIFAELSHPGSWWMTPNQKLTMVGLPTIGKTGDALWIPANMVSIQEPVNPDAPVQGMAAERGETLLPVSVFTGSNGHGRGDES